MAPPIGGEYYYLCGNAAMLTCAQFGLLVSFGTQGLRLIMRHGVLCKVPSVQRDS